MPATSETRYIPGAIPAAVFCLYGGCRAGAAGSSQVGARTVAGRSTKRRRSVFSGRPATLNALRGRFASQVSAFFQTCDTSRPNLQHFDVRCHSGAMDIDSQKVSFQLPIIGNHKLNVYIKAIRDLCGIDKPIFSHVARHTYATRCLNRGIRLEVVAKLLGHSTTRITQHYAKLLKDNIINEVSDAFKKSY